MRIALTLVLSGLGFAVSTAPAAAKTEQDARLACVEFDTDIGEYGASVFRLREKPSACTEYVGNKPCHCTEAPLTRIRWHHWGAPVARATATWHYCGMGTCIYRRAHLIAFRLRHTCGVPAYTGLRMFLPAHGRGPEFSHPIREHFRLPACSTVLEEI
jgi:hypothetical protein